MQKQKEALESIQRANQAMQEETMQEMQTQQHKLQTWQEQRLQEYQEQVAKQLDDQERRITQGMTNLQTQLLQAINANKTGGTAASVCHTEHDDVISMASFRDREECLTPSHSIPRNFDFSQVPKLPQAATLEDFRQWKKTWEDNARAKNLGYYPERSQVSALISAIGPHGSDIIEFSLAIDPKNPCKTVSEILEDLTTFFREERNLAVDRRAYFTRTQKDSETFREFYYALERLSRNACLNRKCNNEECRQDLLVTMIMLGVHNENARKELMKLQPFPSLKVAVATCSAEESTEDNAERVSRSTVNKVSSYRKQRSLSRSKKAQGTEKRCFRCGGEYAKDHKCPAKDKKCNSCGTVGHFSKMCKIKAEKSKRPTDAHVSSVFCANVNHTGMEKTPFCSLKTVDAQFFSKDGKLLGVLKNVLPDSGAAASLMSVQDYERLGRNATKLVKQGDCVFGANGLGINALGRDTFIIQLGDAKTEATMIITDEYTGGTILNRQVSEQLQILPNNFPTQVACEHRIYEVHDDIGRLKQCLLEEFADVFNTTGKLKAMKGNPIHIHLKDGAIPYQVNGPRPIPIPLRRGAKKLIEEMIEQDILEEVNEPTDWLHPFTIVVKPDGNLRLCVDLRMLNKFILRPYHPVRTPKDAVSTIPPGSRYFSIFDAKSGYFQCELDKESQLLTTFVTPWGRFKHKRATMGLSSAGDEFNRRTDAALAGLPNVEKVVDDILIHGKDLESHTKNVREFLERCRQAGITLNPKKAKFAQESVKFAGYVVSRDGISADPDKVKAIAHFPKPTNLTDLRSFVGLAEQLAGFSNKVAAAMSPLRPLMSKNAEFYWTVHHDRAFEETKKALTSPPVLAMFDPKRPTMLQTDAARTRGLGYGLLQKDSQDNWRLVEANSRFITDTESRYAMVELELLAVQWAMKKCHNYLFGLPRFELVVDHQPLVSILDKQTLDCVQNTRIQNLKAATGRYDFTTTWRKGKSHRIPDALSRSPVNDPTGEDLEESQDIYNQTCTQVNTAVLAIEHDIDDWPEDKHTDPLLDEIRSKGQQDEEYINLLKYLRSSNPKINDEIALYRSVLDEISEDEGILVMRQRLIIPKCLRKEVLKRLHASHQGVDRTLRRARQTVFWPGISSDVKSTVRACEACLKYSPSQSRETMKKDKPVTRVFEEVAADLFEIRNTHFLVITDRYSGWPELYEMGRCPNSEQVISYLVEYFSRVGCPIRFCSDGGRQFVSREMRDFLERWGVNQRISSPHFHQSNGLAESAVKSVKGLLKKCGGKINQQFREGYLELRNTPREGGKSPAEILFGHPLRSRVPAHHRAFDSKWLVTSEEHDKKMALKDLQVLKHYNKSARNMKELKPGMRAAVQDPTTKLWDKAGLIMSKGSNRNYRVKFPSGRCLWRNRRFLKPFPNATGDGDTVVKDDGATAKEKESPEAIPRRSKRVRFKTQRFGFQD